MTVNTMTTGRGLAPPEGTPDEIRDLWRDDARVPQFDPTLGVAVEVTATGTPRHRLAAIGDSLTHGFQSGAVFNTDISYPAIIAHELGWSKYRYPRYSGPGGLPINLELLLRQLEERFGSSLSIWELPMALFAARDFMDQVEDYWERGPGASVPAVTGLNHHLGVYGWDLRDALSRTADTCRHAMSVPKDDLLDQFVENDSQRAALRVYPAMRATGGLTLFDVARELAHDHDQNADTGLETLIVFLGANNALGSVAGLKVAWSDVGFDDLERKARYTVWRPSHFAQEFDEVVERVKEIGARHVIWCTVPHVTIAPIARGVGRKITPGSQYFPFCTRPWIRDADFDRTRDRHITGAQACAVDIAVDRYNAGIEQHVRRGRQEGRDWFLLDIAGLLDRLASRRFIEDPNARPEWWTPFPLPPTLSALRPVPDSRFLSSDGHGGRASGGLFSLDGVHPTTVAYGLIAQEMINIMRLANVEFFHGSGALRTDPVTVDFNRLVLRDTLLSHPPGNLTSTLDIMGWADENLGWVRRALGWAF
jgi:hypothetical protein